MVHYFLVDLNDYGEYYRLGIETDLPELNVMSYLEGLSGDVRFLQTKDAPNLHSKGTRSTPVGIVRSCKFFKDKISSFGESFKIYAPSDKRHKVYSCE